MMQIQLIFLSVTNNPLFFENMPRVFEKNLMKNVPVKEFLYHIIP